jgi:hypothetical protein
LLTVSASAASTSASIAASAVSTATSAAVHCHSFSTTRSGINQNSSEVFGGHSNSFGNSLGILWIRFSC